MVSVYYFCCISGRLWNMDMSMLSKEVPYETFRKEGFAVKKEEMNVEKMLDLV